MKKVLNINFQGRIIPIEESAFEQVQNYIQSLRAYFQNEEGRDEIINDIEDRIAELFEKEIKKGAVCITDQIASSVIAGMGKVEDFEKLDGEPQERAEASSSNTSANLPKGSLMRNSNDKILGGVCSGIAHTLRIDPTVVRVLFALLSFGGGTGILIYLILWIVLPERPLQASTQKRLFRNPDQKVIAGICGGIASYFNIPVWIPRIIFLIPVIAGIFSSAFSHLFILTGGFGGTLFLTYIILWLVLPVAKTPTEKMQMRGDKIDVSSIKSAVQDEMQGVKGRLEYVGKQLKSGAERMSKEASETAGMLSQKISSSAGTTGNRIVHMIGIFFKVVFWIFAGAFAFVFLMTFTALTISALVVSPMSDVVFSKNAQEWAFWGTILFFFLTPAVSIVIWMIRKIAGVQSSKHYLSYIFATLWTIGWFSIFYLVSSIVNDFSHKKETTTKIAVPSAADTLLRITTSQPPLEYSGLYSWIHIEGEEADFNITEDSLFYNNVKLTVAKSEDSNTNVICRKISYGASGKEAEGKAKNINHRIKASENIVDLDYSIGISRKDLFRAQGAEVVFQLPVGKKIIFDKKLTDKLNHFSVKRKKEWRDDDFEMVIVEENLKYEPDIVYVMTENGLIKYQETGLLPTYHNQSKSVILPNRKSEMNHQKQNKNILLGDILLPVNLLNL